MSNQTDRVKVYYRYTNFWADCREVTVSLHTYSVVSRTPKGGWIRDDRVRTKKRFVLDSARRKFAYPTKELALASFVKRKEWESSHAKRQSDVADKLLETINAKTTPFRTVDVMVYPDATNYDW